MSDYIKREDALAEVCRSCMMLRKEDGLEYCLVKCDEYDRVNALPAADVVEVVRCKDCRWGKEACGNIECFADLNAQTEYHGYNWFCPNGERRSE